MKKLLFLFFTLSLLSAKLYSQEAVQPRPSPTAIVTMKYEDTYIKITYCQPHKNGRSIFGELVPFGEIWRTGANEATEITTTKNILIGGKTLEAGTYSIFTIPEKNNWTIIMNSGLGQWGSYTYNSELDVLSISGKVSNTGDDTWEAFTIAFEQNNDQADLVMIWDQVKISVPIEFMSNN